MRKQKVSFQLRWFATKENVIHAKREVPYEVKLASKLFMDELFYTWNKEYLERELNKAIDQNDKEKFLELSQLYRPYTFE